jgi:hypothetical protein
MIQRHILAAALFASAGFIASAMPERPALAQAAAPAQPAPALIQAVAYKPIPAGSGFDTQVNDDSELNQEALQRVNAELGGRGYAVSTGAGLVMVIETALVRGQKQDDPLGQVHADNNDAEINARLFSSSQNSLLNPRQPIGSADRTFRVSLSVYDRASGLYVWRGTATRNDPQIDVNQAGNEMIAALIGALGKSVQPAPK